MRTTEGKPTLETRTWGARELAGELARALEHRRPVERATHGFHTYPAGLHPDAARDLLALFPGGRVHDPFCGGGTVLIEAMLAGRVGSGADISPVARLVTRARTRKLSPQDLTAFRSAGRRITEQARSARRPPPQPILDRVRDWYAPWVLAELEAIRAALDVPGDVGTLLRAAFSSLLVKTSWQASDTSPARLEHDRPPGTAAILFHKKVRELGRRLEAIAAAPGPSPDVTAASADAGWGVRSVDLVLTSPPYPAVYDYVLMQRLRAAWLMLAEPVELELGPRQDWDARAAARWEAATGDWTARAARALVPGGQLVVVVGDGLVDAGPVDARGPTLAAADGAGLAFLAGASLARPDYSRRDVRWEHVLAFRRVARA